VEPTNAVTFGIGAALIGMSDHRKAAWDALIIAAFGRAYSDVGRRQLVALINLTGSNASREETLDRAALDGGVTAVVEKVQLLHPRVVLALSNAVFDRLQPALGATTLEGDGAADGPHGSPLRAAIFKDQSADFDVLLLKAAQHPSRPVHRPKNLPTLSQTELLVYGVSETVNRFLHRRS
jgi:hypothetical protein